MLKKLHILPVLALSLTLVFAPSSAVLSEPAGSCPRGFDLHNIEDHVGDPEHQHVGTSADKNDDGYICMKMVDGGDIHVHVDNRLP